MYYKSHETKEKCKCNEIISARGGTTVWVRLQKRSLLHRGAPRSIHRTYEISVKSRRRIFRVTFTQTDWHWPIFDGEKTAAFSATAAEAAASENFLVVASDKKFVPRSDEGRRRVVKFPMKSDSGRAIIANLHKRRKRNATSCTDHLRLTTPATVRGAAGLYAVYQRYTLARAILQLLLPTITYYLLS